MAFHTETGDREGHAGLGLEVSSQLVSGLSGVQLAGR